VLSNPEASVMLLEFISGAVVPCNVQPAPPAFSLGTACRMTTEAALNAAPSALVAVT
jgi:hypothetical protein